MVQPGDALQRVSISEGAANTQSATQKAIG
jgi:hypothetical protein